MKKLLILLLISPFWLSAQTLNGLESVDCDTSTNTWYVGNTGSGKILKRILPATTWQDFAAGMSNGPSGIEVVGGRIYACAGASIKGFQLSDGAPVFSITTTATFLNGITHDDAGLLYATDFSGKKVYKINPATNTSSVFVANTISTPNGIIFDKINNRLVYVSWGSNAKIYGISMPDSSTTVLKTTTLSNIDGVAMDASGCVYVASWGANALHRFATDFSGSPTLISSGLNKPADIFYNLKSDTIGIPNSGNNTVQFIGITQVSSENEAKESLPLQIFPNPTSDWLAVAWPDEKKYQQANLSVFSAIGQKMILQTIQKDAEKMTLNVKDFPPGLYQVEFKISDETGETRRVGTFVKR